MYSIIHKKKKIQHKEGPDQNNVVADEVRIQTHDAVVLQRLCQRRRSLIHKEVGQVLAVSGGVLGC